MMTVDRMFQEDRIQAMVAADTFTALVQRIQPMVTAGRRMALAVREFTYLHRPPRVYAGLILDTEEADQGVWTDTSDGRVGFGIVLTNGGDRYGDSISLGFGEDIHQYSGNETERQAWDRYHQHQAEATDHFDRRRDMTHIAVSGGLPGFRYRNTDQIVVTTWNRDGVATEKVLVFEPEDGSW